MVTITRRTNNFVHMHFITCTLSTLLLPSWKIMQSYVKAESEMVAHHSRLRKKLGIHAGQVTRSMTGHTHCSHTHTCLPLSWTRRQPDYPDKNPGVQVFLAIQPPTTYSHILKHAELGRFILSVTCTTTAKILETHNMRSNAFFLSLSKVFRDGWECHLFSAAVTRSTWKTGV